jgi:hypothetical protein
MSKRRRGGGYVDMEESKYGDERDFKIEADWKEQSQGTVQWQWQRQWQWPLEQCFSSRQFVAGNT